MRTSGGIDVDQDVLVLSRDVAHGGQWMATYGGPWRARIVDAFGTDTLPTPYRWHVNASEVLTAVRLRNPEGLRIEVRV